MQHKERALIIVLACYVAPTTVVYSLDEYRPLQLALQPVAVCAEASQCYTAKVLITAYIPLHTVHTQTISNS
jgi:hypothetical protein